MERFHLNLGLTKENRMYHKFTETETGDTEKEYRNDTNVDKILYGRVSVSGFTLKFFL